MMRLWSAAVALIFTATATAVATGSDTPGGLGEGANVKFDFLDATGDWVALTSNPHYGPNVGGFDDDAPSVFVNDGAVAALTGPQGLATLYAGQKANQIKNILVLLTLSPDATLTAVTLTLVDEHGAPLKGADPNAAHLQPQNAIAWNDAGFPDPIAIPGFGNQQDPFPRDEGSVLGAIILFDPGLADILEGDVLASVHYELLGMTTGAVRIDFFGIGDDGALLFNSPNSGGAYYIIPEPSSLTTLCVAAVIGLARTRRRHV